MIIAVGVTVLVLAGVTAVVVRVILMPCCDNPGPPVAAGPSFAAGELTPEESTVVATPQPDGTVQVEQKLIFDAGPGMDYPVTWYIGGTQIGWQSSAREARYGVIPTISGVTAREITTTGGTVDLAVSVDDSGIDDPFFDGHRYRLAAPGPWAPGRHAVMISYTLGEVWVQADGVRILVVPLRFGSGPANRQPADLVRLQVPGASALECPATNVDFADRRACGTGDRLVYHDGELDQVEAVVVPDPAGVTAEPIPVREKRL
jgi:hypothetical protein